MALPDRLQSLTLTWSVLAATIKEAQLSTGYRSAMRLSSKRIAIHPRVARWLWKANADSDTTDQFLALWIALNVLYGQYQVKGKRERDAIEAFANHMVGPNATQVLSAILALSGDQCLQVLTDRWLMLRPGFRVGSALRAALRKRRHPSAAAEVVKICAAGCLCRPESADARGHCRPLGSSRGRARHSKSGFSEGRDHVRSAAVVRDSRGMAATRTASVSTVTAITCESDPTPRAMKPEATSAPATPPTLKRAWKVDMIGRW